MEKPKINEWARRWYVLLGRVEALAAEATLSRDTAWSMMTNGADYHVGKVMAYLAVLRNMELLMKEESEDGQEEHP